MAASSGEFFGRYPPMDGCLSGSDGIMDQRPYHRNCKCELHKSRNKHNCPHGATGKKGGSVVSYPIRRSWSEGCLALSSLSSPASSPGGYASPDPPAPPPPIPGKKMTMKKQQQRQGSASDDDDDDLFPQMMKIKN